MKTRSSHAALFTCLLAACLLPACKKSESPSAGDTVGLRPVKLALNWVPENEFGGYYEAREKGYFRTEGLDASIQAGGAGVPVVQMVASGQADFGIAGADEVILARTRGADVVPIWATFQTAPTAIMTPAARGANTLADVFSGGTLAVEPGLVYVAFLKKKYGFDKVKVVPYDGGVARFATEKDYAQQCYVTTEPIVARRHGVEPKIFPIAAEGFNPYAGLVIVRRATWQNDPALVRSFLRAIRRGWRSYLDSPAATDAVMATLNPTMDAQTFAEAGKVQRPLIETDATRAGGLGVMDKARWETLAAQLVDLGTIEKAPPIEDYWIAPASLAGP